MNQPGASLAALAIALGSLVACSSPSPSPPAEPPIEREAISLALPGDPVNWLMVVAVQEGLLDQAGLDVTVTDYPSGKRALAGMLAGESDLATTADVPFVAAVHRGEAARLVATIGVSDSEMRVIARRDRGIGGPADLRGKRVATQRASAVHYFLDAFLLSNGLTSDDVEMSFLKAEELPDALVSGEIDAFSMREPFIGQAAARLGEQALVMAEPGLYLKTFCLVAAPALLSERPEVVRRVLRALLEAEELVRSQPERARDAVARRLGIEPARVAAAWSGLELEVSLRQSLLVTLEVQSAWVVRNGHGEARAVPDFLDHVSVAELAAVRPDRVTLLQVDPPSSPVP